MVLPGMSSDTTLPFILESILTVGGRSHVLRYIIIYYNEPCKKHIECVG
jgi:hypothetical protein